jgi:Arylsulfotransferase (ASST)
MTSQTWTRRQLLTRAGLIGAGLAGLGTAGVLGVRDVLGGPSAASAAAARQVRHYVSRPDLTPPAVTISRAAALPSPGRRSRPPGFSFIAAAQGGPGQGGLMIVSAAGDLIWFSPAAPGASLMNFGVQAYQGKPVLTWWEGTVVNGHGQGQAVMADSSYRPARTIKAARGLQADLHEFVLTPHGTALLTAYRQAPADLSALGGPVQGSVLSGVAQEIDVATGRLLFAWDSLDHVPVTDSYLAFSGGTTGSPYDYFHINSLALDDDGDLLISARNTWTVYKVSRPGGAIRWRLGGRRSSFTMGTGARFYWQHHARPHGNQRAGARTLSLFDDGAAPQEEPQSRAIVLDLDMTAMRASLTRQFVHPGGLLAGAMGSAQLLDDGGMFVGWGTQPRYSEFSADGRLVADAQLPANDESYRAFTHPWSGHPADRPAAAARAHPAGVMVYASWNGATGIARWTVLAGKTPSSLTPAAAARTRGFETAILAGHRGPYFAAQAHDPRGRVLGRSPAVRVS